MKNKITEPIRWMSPEDTERFVKEMRETPAAKDETVAKQTHAVGYRSSTEDKKAATAILNLGGF